VSFLSSSSAKPRAVGAISEAASKLMQNTDFDFVIYSSFLLFT
jgi:hypothetical protein